MRLIAAVALLVLLFASPALALTQDEAQAVVNSTGCTATVKFDTGGFNAYYISPVTIFGILPGDGVIILDGMEDLSDKAQTFILLHESGHCMQVMHGREYYEDGHGIYSREYDADEFAIDRFAERGWDGAEMQHELFAYLYSRFNKNGDADDVHGLLVDRIMHGYLHRRVVAIQGA